MPKERMGTKVNRNTKIIFYESGGKKVLRGEAAVISSDSAYPRHVLEVLGDTMFLSEDEFWDYVNKYPGREEKRLLYILIDDPVHYDPPIPWKSNMTMMGVFLSSDDYRKTIQE